TNDTTSGDASKKSKKTTTAENLRAFYAWRKKQKWGAIQSPTPTHPNP
ncbi:11351_t:CDS:1, partial [Racocetra persica]